MARLLQVQDKILAKVEDDPARTVPDEFTTRHSVLIACPAYHEFVTWANIKLGRNADFKAAETLQARLAMRLGKNFGEIDLMPLADAMRVMSENPPAPLPANQTAPIWAERPDGGRVAFYPEKCIGFPLRSDGDTDEMLYFDPSDQQVILWERRWVLTAKNNVPGPPILVDGPCRIVSLAEAREALRRAGKAIPKELDISSPPPQGDERPAVAPASGAATPEGAKPAAELSAENRAMAVAYRLVKEGRPPTISSIAKEAKCNRSYLYRCKPLRDFLATAEKKGKPPRGSKNRETGTIEAWRDDD
jgi:hypothetical protein